VGPVGASCLIKLCAHRRDLDGALELYYRMCAVRTTLNKFTYNCLLHLCGLLGRVNDAMDILAIMVSEAESNIECKPDGYSYSAVLHAIHAAKRWESLNIVFFAILKANLVTESQPWCLLISGATHAGKIEWADNYWKGWKASCGVPDVVVYNVYLGALSRAGRLEQIQSLIQEMEDCGLRPDAYTFVSLLTAVARASSSVVVVEGLVLEMRRRGIQLNLQLGAALLNAYKRAPELTYLSPAQVDPLLERANSLLRELRAKRLVSNLTFGLMAGVYIQAGQAQHVEAILAEGTRAGCPPDANGYRALGVQCDEAGLSEQATHYRTLFETMEREKMQAKKKTERQAQWLSGDTSWQNQPDSVKGGRTMASAR